MLKIKVSMGLLRARKRSSERMAMELTRRMLTLGGIVLVGCFGSTRDELKGTLKQPAKGEEEGRHGDLRSSRVLRVRLRDVER